jgi:AcrR family transcriptional regulator
MIESGVELFRERGVQGTAFADVLERSGAPRGSVYHHFPGGKEQFAIEVIVSAGDAMTSGLEALLDQTGPIEALGLLVDGWAQMLVESDFEAGCPILAAVVEGSQAGPARDEAVASFRRSQDLITGALERAGVPQGRSRDYATTVIASIEGAVALARAERSVEPLRRVADVLGEMFAAALASA